MEEKQIQEAVAKTKEELVEKAAENLKPTDEEQNLIDEAIKEVNGPIVLKDDKVVLGQQEVDIRKLSKANKDQISFRLLSQQLAYAKFDSQTLTDIMRLLMVIIKILKPGCNISDEIDDAMNQLSKEVFEKTTKKDEKLN